MRKLSYHAFISADGFFEGPNKELDWHNVDAEFNSYLSDFYKNIDTLLFGRITYDLMFSYWASPDTIAHDPIVAGKMNSLSKLVVSSTLTNADWNNTRLVKENIAEEIIELKQQPGKDIAILGSSDLAVSLIKYHLIDEFWICISPIFLGNGKRLFQGMTNRLHLTLVKTRSFRSGNILLYYKPQNQ